MNLNEYQQLAAETDKFEDEPGSTADLAQSRVIPILGLVGEVGSVVVEFKKLLQSGQVHSRYRQQLAEELGDMLWYVANIATKADLTLEEIALFNLDKVSDRYNRPKRRYLYDNECPPDQQLPRRFAYRFAHKDVSGRTKLQMTDIADGVDTGNPLTDNAYEDDGYRYHDAMHLAFCACLGWSPVLRKLLRDARKIKQRFSDKEGDDWRVKTDVEDGGRAQVIEEAIVAAAYVYYDRHPGATTIEWPLLRHIRELISSSKLEVCSRAEAEWENALLEGFKVWNALRENKGGIIRGDLDAGTIEFSAT